MCHGFGEKADPVLEILGYGKEASLSISASVVSEQWAKSLMQRWQAVTSHLSKQQECWGPQGVVTIAGSLLNSQHLFSRQLCFLHC